MFDLFDVFIDAPALALLPATLFALGYAASRSRAALVMAALWAIYAVLEFGNKARITCSGECNIRVDLLVIAPGLLIGSAIAVIAVARRLARRPRP